MASRVHAPTAARHPRSAQVALAALRLIPIQEVATLVPTLDEEAVPQSRTPKRRSYSREQKAEAVGLAMSIGVKQAGRKLRIPYRSISHWLEKPEYRAIVAQSRERVAAQLWLAVETGTREVLAGLQDKSAPLSHKAQALRVVAEQHALLTGGATQRTESRNESIVGTMDLDAQAARLSDEERLVLREWSRRVVSQKQAQYIIKAAVPMLPEPEAPDDV